MRSRGSEAAEGSQLLFPGERELAGGKRAGHPAGFFCHPPSVNCEKQDTDRQRDPNSQNIYLRYGKTPGGPRQWKMPNG